MKKPAQLEHRSPKRIRPAPPNAPAPPRRPSFPIVGIGASAGGLEALEQFLRHVPAHSGLAVVIVQHLDPTRKGVLPELLQRASTMTVREAEDRMKVQQNCAYVIPPNKDLTILRGVLHLLEPAAPRGLRLPIDLFLRSLAQDQGNRSVGVILSGMGADGTLGLRAIKEKAGLVLVQEPATAKFDGMPRSAIEAGLADFVAPAPELPGKLMAFLRHTPLIPPATPVAHHQVQSHLEKIVILLRAHTGHDFSLYKASSLHRRIERRMGLHQIDKIPLYERYLQENPQELGLLFKELLIGVTSFFRDPEAWKQLGEQALRALIASHSSRSALRAWVPGCSTGEEAYSLAIIFKEAWAQLQPRGPVTLQVFATDLDRDAISQARQGFFPENIAADVSPKRLDRFFRKQEHGYKVNKEIRDMIIFAPQNLLMDPPFAKLDLISCRNLLIYLTAESQKNLFPLFHYSLNPGGVLFLGGAESIGGFTHLFSPLGSKARLFRRTEFTLAAARIEFPSSFVAASSGGADPIPAQKALVSLQSIADQLVLQRYAPPSVLVNGAGDILYVSGRTGKYLEPAAGKANWNLFAMARQGLRSELTAAFQKALQKKVTVVRRGLKVEGQGSQPSVDLTVQVLEEPEPLRGMVLVVFAETVAETATPGKDQRGSVRAPKPPRAEVKRELQQAREEVRTTREEMQSSQEELRSINEELQSTNEELTTSKEEMQSLNEELQTVNAELQTKVDELTKASNDMKNLLNSTDIATLFLDNELRVRRFTTQTTRIIKLIPGDVGRPITDLASELCYPHLVTDAQAVLRTLVFAQKPIATRDGRWFTVRIMPYRTMEDRIDGVVMTFTDITATHRREAKLRTSHAALANRARAHSSRPNQAQSRRLMDQTKPKPGQRGAGAKPHIHP